MNKQPIVSQQNDLLTLGEVEAVLRNTKIQTPPNVNELKENNNDIIAQQVFNLINFFINLEYK